VTGSEFKTGSRTVSTKGLEAVAECDRVLLDTELYHGGPMAHLC
jgi:hypothetical protein